MSQIDTDHILYGQLPRRKPLSGVWSEEQQKQIDTLNPEFLYLDHCSFEDVLEFSGSDWWIVRIPSLPVQWGSYSQTAESVRLTIQQLQKQWKEIIEPGDKQLLKIWLDDPKPDSSNPQMRVQDVEFIDQTPSLVEKLGDALGSAPTVISEHVEAVQCLTVESGSWRFFSLKTDGDDMPSLVYVSDDQQLLGAVFLKDWF